MTEYHVAQVNVGLLAAPIDSPRLAGFVAMLPVINALADASPGFVWRLTDEGGADATSLRPYGPDIALNMSVWTSVANLRAFVYRSRHLAVMRQRREWFRPYPGPYQVMWWVPAGHIPTFDEAAERLTLLAGRGPGPEAFTFREPYPRPGTVAA
jgi:hypothetical protein